MESRVVMPLVYLRVTLGIALVYRMNLAHGFAMFCFVVVIL